MNNFIKTVILLSFVNCKSEVGNIAESKSERFEYGTKLDIITDTIRDFVIISKDSIVLSRKDFELLHRFTKGSELLKRYILYCYK